MKLRYLSDVHLEFIKQNNLEKFINNLVPGHDEVCILAGDIGYPCTAHYDLFMTHVDKSFKKVFVITGNHEYYNNKFTIDEIDSYLVTYFQRFKNISFLNNRFEIYEGYCFIGTTLWSRITDPTNQINDITHIPQLDVEKYNQLNLECVEFLKNTLDENSNCIVITHHVPSPSLIDSKYMDSPYNQWFCCAMDEFIATYKIKIRCWIYGHTHKPSEKLVHDVMCLCNPIGYPFENAIPNFEKTWSI